MTNAHPENTVTSTSYLTFLRISDIYLGEIMQQIRCQELDNIVDFVKVANAQESNPELKQILKDGSALQLQKIYVLSKNRPVSRLQYTTPKTFQSHKLTTPNIQLSTFS
ncbi:hypothetical protein EVAR_59360_1 [Eumeta japonica]|uniref:Uncharacterized protein n=1 Tax=Eumeta variegata TaxID=151549 RepID=A0A4C1SQ20_EUMVA|nr:hypothetical protein EVAR_59360_1 [Eumeta japonica]